MALLLTSGPALEPVSLADAKMHVRVDGSDEDALVTSLIITARMSLEASLGLALINQTWTLVRDDWPRGAAVKLPLWPVQSVAFARVLAADGTPSNLLPAAYVLEGRGLPPRFVRTGLSWPKPGRVAGGIEISFVAGFGPAATDVPLPIRQALLLLIAHWYEHREPLEIGATDAPIPKPVSDLMAPFRAVQI
jgi:uncharacterized phiE125 gp8 family phage protein